MGRNSKRYSSYSGFFSCIGRWNVIYVFYSSRRSRYVISISRFISIRKYSQNALYFKLGCFSSIFSSYSRNSNTICNSSICVSSCFWSVIITISIYDSVLSSYGRIRSSISFSRNSVS